MAPLPPKDDYYKILEVEQSASTEVITKSYKNLALKLHPDRNSKSDATESFQKLGQAFETLIDPAKRQAYDRLYHSIRRNGVSSSAGAHKMHQNTPPQPAQPTEPSPEEPPEPSPEADRINSLIRKKAQRAAEWDIARSAFESSIVAIKASIEALRQQLIDLNTRYAAEEARENDWTSWITFHLSQMVLQESSEEVKLRKESLKTERDSKERRLKDLRDDLRREENAFAMARMKVKKADDGDSWAIRMLLLRIYPYPA
ncbi:hypothetical protein AC578_5096 [Pseudocercospora eumusae]|uniref:J domain-containing protein n=1 Tax=Pseudocercospora eumusae TaxID=321146 RepID=A0A139HIH4_9PEZI|nr:hypothetical protein AC578_5096 [Pseudocercospora eumusae]